MKLISIFAFLLAFIAHNSIMACTLTMGYRSNERLPLINKQPDNSGLYFHLYNIVAKELGCKFNVVRGSKKRILKLLKKGRIDFYPGFNFTEKRSEFYYYMENGLPGGDIGISRVDMSTITNINQLKGYTLLAAFGAPDFARGVEGIETYKVREMTVDKAIVLIKRKRGDFYIYNKSTLEYYFAKKAITDIKIHPDCCGGIKPLYLAFSRNSPHYQEITNHNFDPVKPTSIENFPVLVSKDSIAFQLQKVLKHMNDDGITNQIYNEYYSLK